MTERLALALCLASFAPACRQDMHDQPRYKPLATSAFFPDGRSARPLVEGTLAQDALRDDPHLYTGTLGGKLVDTFPFPITAEVLARGRERFDIYCAPCHGRLGSGDGMVVRRGFRRPPTYHRERLRKAPVGHFFDVMTRGLGAMPPYSERVPVHDRWAIAAYVRALQLSQNVDATALSDDERAKLGAPGP